MTDIVTIFDPMTGAGDWSQDPTDGSDLATAVLISLLTDRTADADDVIPDASGDPRGWWADLGADRPIGSKIWLRLRSKQVPLVLALVKSDIEQALQWLIDDGVAASVDVATSWGAPKMLTAKIVIRRANGTEVALQYGWAWTELN